MKETTFWKLLDEITRMGNFITAVPNEGASANIVGELRLGQDGGERVIEREKCHCHVHLYPEKIAKFSFGYRDVGFGQEPCLELLISNGQAALRLYYRGNDATGKYKEFSTRNTEHAELLSGAW